MIGSHLDLGKKTVAGLDIFQYQNIFRFMAPLTATADAFAAVADVKRRRIIDLLASGERPVNDVVRLLGVSQPQVSKHLKVLRQVGLVSVRRTGRQRYYHLNGERLQPVHAWVREFERFWTHQLGRIKARAEAAAKEPPPPHPDPNDSTPDSQERSS